MKLNKRNCGIRIRLTPCGADFQKIQLNLDGKRQDFMLSSIMGDQFSSFLDAVYCLYEEEEHTHWFYRRRSPGYTREYHDSRENGKYATRIELNWDGEGYGYANVILLRESVSLTPPPVGQPDPVTLIIRRRKSYHYTLDGRDLCYAVAKAYTEAMKKYGFKGFVESCAGHDPGDSVDIDQLLFIKAYALGISDVRTTRKIWENPNGWCEAVASSFENEMELLLFDM